MKNFYIIIINLLIGINLYPQNLGEDFCSSSKTSSFNRLSKISEITYPGDSNIDVTYYRLNLKVTANPNFLEGKITIKAKPTVNSLSLFYLDLKNNLAVSKVLSGITNLSFVQTVDHKLSITLERNYSKGETFTVDIYYSGVPTAGTGTISSASFSFYDSGAQKVTIASLSQPYGARDWWPSKDTPADKPDSTEIVITCSSNLYAVSNGNLTAVIDNFNGTKTYWWKTTYPIANYLISIAVSDYLIYQDEFVYNDGRKFPIIHYNYPTRLTDSRKTVLNKTKNMMKFFSDKFGEYPFIKEKYAHAEFSWSGGMEHQTCTSMGGSAMNSESTIAHELAHQWFGDKITCKDWQNIWLNEGFATYLDKLYHEDAYGVSYFKQLMSTVFSNAKRATGTIYVQNINSESEIFSSARSYNKGAAVLHMLRGIVGDEMFFKILKEYANDPKLAYGVAVTEDFQRVAQQVTQTDLGYFFQQWIYGENYPKYTVGKSIKKNNDDSYSVIFRLRQSANSNPSYFIMPIKVRVSFINGSLDTTLFNNQQEQAWVLNFKNKIPTDIELDPDNWLLKDIIAITKIEDEKLLPSEFELSQNYPNPFGEAVQSENPATVINYKIQKDGYVTLKVYDAIGKEIATLVDEYQKSGEYKSVFRALSNDLPSGVYFYTINFNGNIQSKKMILLK
ncbi:MAG: M1 family aminopeptidase [Melioribacteraceae bacterium]|nr:M1 family aminopeptidase [Melioribacteraceae bacterium]